MQQEERRRAVKVAASVFLSSMLDFAGLAALLPVLYYLLEGESQRSAALFFGVLAVSVVALKGVLAVFLGRFQSRFLLELYRRLSFSLFDAYCRRGLLFIREKGVSRLGYEVNNVCFAFTQSVLAPMLKMAGEALLLFFVTVALLVYDFRTVAVLYAAFLPFLAAYVFAVRKSLLKYGKVEQEAQRRQVRVVNDAFGGFPELDVNDAMDSFRQAFRSGMEEVSRSRLKRFTLMSLPAFLCELAVVVGLVFLAWVSTGDVKMVVGLFAVASFRLLPALRGVVSGWSVMQNAAYCLDIIEEGLEAGRPQKEEALGKEEKVEWQEGLELDKVDFSYADGTKVLEAFSCSVKKGEFVGFKGGSGVGKSTLFNMILGFMEPQSGRILIDGKPLDAGNRHSWLEHVGYVPQEVFLFDGTLAENVALGCKAIDRKRVARILEGLSLAGLVERLPEGMDTVLSEKGLQLSGGERQRVGIARALYRNMDVLLLDEATSALDEATEKEVNGVIRELRSRCKGLTVLLIAHRESTLLYCDRIISMD